MLFQDQEKLQLAWSNIKNIETGTAFTKFVLQTLNKPIGQGLIGVEVGVRDGRNALDLLRYLNIKKLYLVDDFKEYQDKTARFYTQEEQEIEFQKLIKNTEEFFDKTIIVRQTSKLAREIFAERTFDFVYIDGNHDYECVKDDLKWFEYVVRGGVMGGHDYGSYDGDGVKRAVDEFVRIKKQENNGVVGVEDLGGRVRIPPSGAGGVEWAIIKP